MTRLTVLGGSGAVGSVAVKTLARLDYFTDIRICDLNVEKAAEVAADSDPDKVSVEKLDVLDREALESAFLDSDVVLNCVGPFYKFERPVLEAAINTGVKYVDICDDVDVTLEALDMSERAEKAGATAVIGMGSSPGATNLLARFAAENLLDEVHAIDIFHAHGGEPFEGEGVIAHRFHCMTIDVPMFLDGRLQYVKFFEEDGIALREYFDFPILGRVLLYPYPHPEQVTLPRYISCKQVTNKGSVLPEEYYNLIRDMCRLGLAGLEPVQVRGVEVVPQEFATAFIIRERDRILRETGFGEQRGCVSVVARGQKEGKFREYRFHMASRSQALGEGTGIPAAIGAILLLEDKVDGRGVLPPEACINPNHLIELVPRVMAMDEKKEGGDTFGGIIVEEIDESGSIRNLEI
ncbi:MAG: saccharopine dehydrogenase NADP-binding domain-containing protein [bacterium]